MILEVRYNRSFLLDLHRLDPAAYQRVYDFVFIKFMQLTRLETDLPQLRQLGSSAICYRFTLDEYLIAIEVTGHIVKFVRILRQPDISQGMGEIG